MEVVDEVCFFAKERKNHSDCYSSIYIYVAPVCLFPSSLKGFRAGAQRAQRARIVEKGQKGTDEKVPGNFPPL